MPGLVAWQMWELSASCWMSWRMPSQNIVSGARRIMLANPRWAECNCRFMSGRRALGIEIRSPLRMMSFWWLKVSRMGKYGCTTEGSWHLSLGQPYLTALRNAWASTSPNMALRTLIIFSSGRACNAKTPAWCEKRPCCLGHKAGRHDSKCRRAAGCCQVHRMRNKRKINVVAVETHE